MTKMEEIKKGVDEIFENAKKEIKPGEEEFTKAEEYRKNELYDEAYNNYLISAEAGYVPAMNNLGVMYHRGLGCEKSLDNAFYWYNKAVETGYRLSVASAVQVLMQKQKYNDAFIYLNKYTNGIIPDILYRYGELFYFGYLGEVDYNLACKYFKLAKNFGYKDNYYLAHIYLYGLAGEYLDINEGIKILDSMSNDDFDSSIDLAYYFFKNKEYSKADIYIEKCKKLGCADPLEIIKKKMMDKNYSLYGKRR